MEQLRPEDPEVNPLNMLTLESESNAFKNVQSSTSHHMTEMILSFKRNGFTSSCKMLLPRHLI